jgi:hypothetical protein
MCIRQLQWRRAPTRVCILQPAKRKTGRTTHAFQQCWQRANQALFAAVQVTVYPPNAHVCFQHNATTAAQQLSSAVMARLCHAVNLFYTRSV